MQLLLSQRPVVKMTFVVVFFLMINVINAKMEGYIVGGHVARIEDWPFIIFMMFYRGNVGGPGCGGSILSSQTVLTAAHCLDDVTDKKKNWDKFNVSVFMGDADIFKSTLHRLAIDYCTHEKYDPSSTPNDVGVMFLEKPVVFSNVIKKTVLHQQLLNWNLESERNLKAAGWGAWSNPINQTNPIHPKLQTLDQTYVPRKQCLKYVKDLEFGTMCAGTLDTDNYVFNGDSGGPLVTSDGFQIGLVSYKLNKKNGITIYTHIPDFFHWIQKTQSYLYKLHCAALF